MSRRYPQRSAGIGLPFGAGLLLLLLCCWGGGPAGAGEGQVYLREDFEELGDWEPLTFPRISRHSTYGIVKEGGESLLRAESDASASGILLRSRFPVREFPRIRWRWKVDRVYADGDARSKKGDDYPLRLYVIFPWDPSRAGLGERVKYKAARILYGAYPPGSALNYIWSNRAAEKEMIPNAYVDRSMMIVKRGPGDVGAWHIDEADILQDYRRAFGEDPPEEASLAVMNDSDDTGDYSVSYVDFIEVFRGPSGD